MGIRVSNGASEMKVLKKIRDIIGAILLLTTAITVGSVVTHYLTGYFFEHYKTNLSEVTIQIINTFVTFLLLMLAGGMFGRIFHHPKQMRMVKEIMQAIRSISRGEFNVSVDFEKVRNAFGGEIGQIIDGFNNMALNLNQMENMRQEFISNVSHEIQSPLTSIKGFAKVLQNEELPLEERKQYLNIIEFESTRLSKLSDNLLKLTSLESQNQPIEKNRFSLNSQLMYSLLSCEPQIVEKNINMHVNLSKIDVIGDEALLNQVWMNLITNSIKFTPNDGDIFINAKQENDKVIIKVQDTGIGISDEEQMHIFERFYKADKSRDRTTVGNGLGLSIVKKIVEMHNGIVYVESELGQGSLFIVELPTAVE
ncbi:two-component sensor histidine kinase [Bacillus sp. AFS017336]|nr:two-component sensor histidine kinase [Bacillus sp. AFS017336]